MTITITINIWYLIGGVLYFLVSYACLAAASDSMPDYSPLTILLIVVFFLIGPFYMLYGFMSEAAGDFWRWVMLRVYPLQFVTTWIKIKTGHFDYGRLSDPGFIKYWEDRARKDYVDKPGALKGDLYLIGLLRQRREKRQQRK